MENKELFNMVIKELNLGECLAQTQRVSGGYMHKMYKLETTTGRYAVKLLNPSIMKRPDAKGNYEKAESLERILESNDIPIVPALELNGKKLQCVDNQYFYIFNWVDGKALECNEITSEHCKMAGKLLADIHKLKKIEKPNELDRICIDWDKYIELANEKCPEIVDVLKNNRDMLYSAENEYNQALDSAPDITCICDGDMDSKNVLWQDGNPLIIDLECLDYGNPYLEMFNLALSWSGGVLCDIDCEKLTAFISSYKQEFGEDDIDCQALSGIGFSWLDWLEYNVKRALMLECENEEERQLGIGQVHETIDRIVYYDSVREKIVEKCVK